MDGDTVDCRIRLGFHVEVVERLRLCMSDGVGLNAPETRGAEREAGLASKLALRNLLARYTEDDEVPEGEPTPEEIRQMCEEIRKEWKHIKARDARKQEITPYRTIIFKRPKDI